MYLPLIELGLRFPKMENYTLGERILMVNAAMEIMKLLKYQLWLNSSIKIILC